MFIQCGGCIRYEVVVPNLWEANPHFDGAGDSRDKRTSSWSFVVTPNGSGTKNQQLPDPGELNMAGYRMPWVRLVSEAENAWNIHVPAPRDKPKHGDDWSI